MTDRGMTVRHAALIVVIGAVVTRFGTSVAEFIVWPSLVDQRCALPRGTAKPRRPGRTSS